MSTARSSTDRPSWRDSVADVGTLVRFRSSAVRGPSRRRLRVVLAVVGLLTLAAAFLPAFVPGAGDEHGRTRDVLLLLSPTLTAFLALTVLSSVASGGGRELLSREHGVAFPVSVLTDHLGALLMAPLNIAWIVQAWTLLTMTAFALGPSRVLGAQVVVVLWLLVATAAGQVAGWSVELVRRGPRGVALVRLLGVSTAGLFAWLVATDRLVPLLDWSPTLQLLITMTALEGVGRWFVTVALLVLSLVALVAFGALPAGVALRRSPRDEARLETGLHPARPDTGSDLAAVIRVDLGSVLRSLPLRRGLMTLAVLPGGIALAGDLDWDMIVLMPGLVASGAALLFGVNAWCLDARGAVWRESLPVDARTVFHARAAVIGLLLFGASAITLALAAVRAGVPTAAELTSVLGAWVVVTVLVVSASLKWSVRNPFPVDLRSARATPAPPAVMVGYSAKLALSTTLVGLLFSVFAVMPWPVALVVAALWVLVAWSRVLRSRSVWNDPVERARVVMTVAG